jgi:hypothetical protein
MPFFSDTVTTLVAFAALLMMVAGAHAASSQSGERQVQQQQQHLHSHSGNADRAIFGAATFFRATVDVGTGDASSMPTAATAAQHAAVITARSALLSAADSQLAPTMLVLPVAHAQPAGLALATATVGSNDEHAVAHVLDRSVRVRAVLPRVYQHSDASRLAVRLETPEDASQKLAAPVDSAHQKKVAASEIVAGSGSADADTNLNSELDQGVEPSAEADAKDEFNDVTTNRRFGPQSVGAAAIASRAELPIDPEIHDPHQLTLAATVQPSSTANGLALRITAANVLDQAEIVATRHPSSIKIPIMLEAQSKRRLSGRRDGIPNAAIDHGGVTEAANTTVSEEGSPGHTQLDQEASANSSKANRSVKSLLEIRHFLIEGPRTHGMF